mgnify:CR=1 FL=1
MTIEAVSLWLSGNGHTVQLKTVGNDPDGFGALRGLTGMGLPPMAAHVHEGAGDGQHYAGHRVLPRDIDIPIAIRGGGRQRVREHLVELATVLAPGPELPVLWCQDAVGERWFTHVYRAGGGDHPWGTEAHGTTRAAWTLTLRAPDPFWVRERPESLEVRGDDVNAGLLPFLAELRLSSSQAFGVNRVVNPGSALAFPVWTVLGPGTGFEATGPGGVKFTWTGTLAEGEVLTIDTKTGRVTDQTGARRYAEMGPAPRFWGLPPGQSTVTVLLSATSEASRVQAFWQPRAWLVF